MRTVSSSSITEVSGVERIDAAPLNTGETTVVGVADAELTAFVRPRVTGMVGGVARGGQGTEMVDKGKFCVATNDASATRRA